MKKKIILAIVLAFLLTGPSTACGLSGFTGLQSFRSFPGIGFRQNLGVRGFGTLGLRRFPIGLGLGLRQDFRLQRFQQIRQIRQIQRIQQIQQIQALNVGIGGVGGECLIF